VSRPGIYDERQVSRLAEQGVEGADVAQVCQLVGRLQADPRLRERFDAAVRAGHARFRAELAARLSKEAARGKASPLLAAARAWLARYAEELTPEVEAGVVERLEALVEDALEHRQKIDEGAADA